MAVQKSRKSRSRTGKKRSHMASELKLAPLSVDPETGEIHRRHHITAKGFYRGKEIIKAKTKNSAKDTDSAAQE